jgi:hypothetical protein
MGSHIPSSAVALKARERKRIKLRNDFFILLVFIIQLFKQGANVLKNQYAPKPVIYINDDEKTSENLMWLYESQLI